MKMLLDADAYHTLLDADAYHIQAKYMKSKSLNINGQQPPHPGSNMKE